jgi:carboxymethylenebutenolidase
MCDESTFASKRAPGAAEVSRRRFGALTVGAGIALLLPRAASAVDVTAAQIDVRTPDGLADCHFVHPVSGRHPGVLIWPDARGMRAAYRQMAQRLAESGYAVLVVNPYYRGKRGPALPEGADPRQGDTMNVLRPLLAQLSPQTNLTDAVALMEFLDGQAAVDVRRPAATTGYCLGGPVTMITAAQFPQRIRAACSFHGVRLATDAADSPHLLVPKMQASYLFCIADDDDEREPEVKNVLRRAFETAGLDAEIEVYEGAMHSWCTPDSPVHHAAQAERAWGRMLALFATALA